MNLINLFAVAVVSFFSSVFGSNETIQNSDASFLVSHKTVNVSHGATNLSYSKNSTAERITYNVSGNSTSVPSYDYMINAFYCDISTSRVIYLNSVSNDSSSLSLDTFIADICNVYFNLGGFGFFDVFYGNNLLRLYYTCGYEFYNSIRADLNMTTLYCPYFKGYSNNSTYTGTTAATYNFGGSTIGLGHLNEFSFNPLVDVLDNIDDQEFLENNPYQFLYNRQYSPMDFSGDCIVSEVGYYGYCFNFYPIADYYNTNISAFSYIIDVHFDFVNSYGFTNLGYNQGYDDGYSVGKDVGYVEGYDAGYDEGRDIGFEYGYDTGQSEGYSSGYSDGYTEADNQDATAVAIFTGIIDVGLIPINFFLAMLNFEVFGINIGGMVASFLTIAIVVIIIRVVTGNKNDD